MLGIKIVPFLSKQQLKRAVFEDILLGGGNSSSISLCLKITALSAAILQEIPQNGATNITLTSNVGIDIVKVDYYILVYSEVDGQNYYDLYRK